MTDNTLGQSWTLLQPLTPELMKQMEMTMPIQKIHTYEYDSEGRETKVTIQGTAVGDTLKILRTVEIERDARGHVIKETETEW